MEVWKDIAGYEGRYQVSNIGRVRSLDMTHTMRNRFGLMERTRKGVVLKNRLTRSYYQVSLYKNGVMKQPLVHRLVATAFLPNPENKPQVNHKDGNKLNNNLENLEWVTAKENTQHAINALGISKDGGKQKTTMKVVSTDCDTGEKEIFKSINEAQRKGFTKAHIRGCLRGNRKTYRNRTWERVNENE